MLRDRHLDWKGVVLYAAGFVDLHVSYTLALQDAQRGAITFNESQESRFFSRQPEAP